MFLLLIQELESKSVEKKAVLWGNSSSQGPELLRDEGELLWRLKNEASHPSIISFREQTVSESLLCAR